MGCTYDVVNIRLENENHIELFKNSFNELLKDYLYDGKYENFLIRKNKNEHWIAIQEEGLFSEAQGLEFIEYFVTEFAKQYPNIKFYMDYKCTYNNCGDANYVEYNYDGGDIITVKSMNAEISGIFDCPECETYFEDALVEIEEYNPDQKYYCPECSAEIEYNVFVNKYNIKLKNEE